MKNKKTAHSVYNLNYHIVFVTKYRHNVLKGKVEDFAKNRLKEICESYDWEMLEMEIMPDHIHIFVSSKPEVSSLTIGSTIKSILTVDIFKEFKTMKKKYFWGSGLFSDGAYCGSAGTVSSETIKKYIQEQKTK